ncbi:MAG TPA: DUF2723 domain-containing protein [Thermoflexia bacterium]|nr:DUF2723 domain-containing protein [Thermoflexia bacterium]
MAFHLSPHPTRKTAGLVGAALAFAIALGLYVATLLPDVLPADAGEFQLVAATAGVAHPPGYPLYSMLGWLATRLPWGSGPAWRVNLLSAVIGAGTVALAFDAGRRMSRSVAGGVVAALTLGSATTFWATATQASIRPLVAFFTALCLDALLAYRPPFAPRPSPAADRALTVFAAGFSLGLTHHPSLAFPGLFFLAYLVWADPRLLITPRRWWRPLLAALPGLLVLLYLPVRAAAGAPLAPADLTTWDGFWEHVLARGFRGDMFAFATPEALPDRLALLPDLLRLQFNPVLLAAAGLGGVILVWKDRRSALLLLGGLVLHTFVTLTYRAPQTVEYEMPAYVILALLAAAPLVVLAEGAKGESTTETQRARSFGKIPLRPLRLCGVVLFLAAGLSNLLAHLPSFVVLARTEDTRAVVEPVLRAAPEQAVILADWHWATPMWYLQQVEGLRPDLEVQYVYPIPGREYGEVWQERLEALLPERPVVVTHWFPQMEADHTLSPVGMAFAVDQVVEPLSLYPLGTTLGGTVELVGTGERLTEGRPGLPLEVTLVWEPRGPLKDPVSLFVHLIGPDGRLWGEGRDRSYGPENVPVGERRVERFIIVPYLHAPPGRYTLVAGAYRPTEGGWERLRTPEGAEWVVVGEVTLRPMGSPPASRHPFLWPHPIGARPALVGVDYDRSIPHQLRVYLHWRGPSAGGEALLEGANLPAQAIPLPTVDEPGYFTTVIDLPPESRDLRVRVGGRTVHLPAPGPEERYVLFGGEVALVGLEIEDTDLPPGSSLEVQASFLALRPLLHDRHVTVRLIGEGWWSLNDGTPALGAIPTLKWIAGSQVTDRRVLRVPPDAPPGEAVLYLGWYDAFSGEPLKVLDERFIETTEALPVGNLPIAP